MKNRITPILCYGLVIISLIVSFSGTAKNIESSEVVSKISERQQLLDSL